MELYKKQNVEKQEICDSDAKIVKAMKASNWNLHQVIHTRTMKIIAKHTKEARSRRQIFFQA